ncbi:MAG TPA: FtsX-like permease family protein [Pseudomonadales bacterium]
MLADYLRGFWRGVLHHKMATFINVGGLALGLTVFFALTFYVDREFSWDAHWDDAERIFVPIGIQETPTGMTPLPPTFIPYVLGTALQSLRPGDIEAYARVHSSYGTILVDEEEYPNRAISYVEPGLFDLVQFDVVEGALRDVLADPRSLAVNAAFAETYFGNASPLGATISFRTQQGALLDFVVKAVYRVPGPSNFAATTFLALFDPGLFLRQNAQADLWQFQPPPASSQPGTPGKSPLYVAQYLKLRDGVDIREVESDLRAFMDAAGHMDSGNSKTRFAFSNIRELHLQPSPFEAGDNLQRLLVFAAIGVLVLLISGCNFVMLATLRLADRMREVGIRKSVGGGGTQLMGQYLFDAFFHTLVAALLAVLFLAFAFPRIAVMLELPRDIQLVTPGNLGLCLLMVIAFTLVSSLYPAWLTSRAKPAPLLRNGAGAVVGTGTGLRKLLVGIQFSIVVVLLLASAVVREQIDYTRNRDAGYSLEDVIAFRLNGFSGPDAYRTIVTEFGRVPGIEVVATGAVSPGTVMLSSGTLVKHIAPDGSIREAALQSAGVGPGYMRAMSVRILAGREFIPDDEPPPSTDDAPDGIGKSLLNEAAVRALGFPTPDAALDQLLESEINSGGGQMRKRTTRVIGVVADTQFSSVMLPPVPQLYNFSSGNPFLAAKLAPGADRTAVNSALEAVWNEVGNGTPYRPAEEALLTGFQLRREEFEARIVTGSTALAIAIALLGLYGLVAATVVKRVKEIGVRKVMGAERSSIVTLFLWQFSKPIVVANLVAWPFGFWAIKQWLTRFPYQLDTFVIVLSGLAASVLALLIAWLTVGAMAARAASVNPVKALRYE